MAVTAKIINTNYNIGNPYNLKTFTNSFTRVLCFNDTKELTKKLQLALDEVVKVEKGSIKSTNARDFLDEL